MLTKKCYFSLLLIFFLTRVYDSNYDLHNFGVYFNLCEFIFCLVDTSMFDVTNIACRTIGLIFLYNFTM